MTDRRELTVSAALEAGATVYREPGTIALEMAEPEREVHAVDGLGSTASHRCLAFAATTLMAAQVANPAYRSRCAAVRPSLRAQRRCAPAAAVTSGAVLPCARPPSSGASRSADRVAAPHLRSRTVRRRRVSEKEKGPGVAGAFFALHSRPGLTPVPIAVTDSLPKP